VVDVGEGGLGQRAQRLVLDDQHVAAHNFFHPHPADAELSVRRLVGAEGEERRVVVGGYYGGGGGVHEQGLVVDLELPNL
jgi:hypothetical protein